MVNTENITKQLFKSAQLPEISADFNLKVMEEINLLPKQKPIAVKPLLHPMVLWLGLLLPIFIAITLYFAGFTLESKFTESLKYLNFFRYFGHLSGNYLLTTYALLVLLWFIIDYKLIGSGKNDFWNKKYNAK